MPKGIYDRTKTKAQRDAEKALGAKSSTPKKVKAAKTVKNPVSKVFEVKAAKPSVPEFNGYNAPASTSKDRIELLMDILTAATCAKQQGAGSTKVQSIIDTVADRLLQEVNTAFPSFQKLPVALEEAKKAYTEEKNEKPLPAPVVAAQPSAPMPAPVQFNPPAAVPQSNGA